MSPPIIIEKLWDDPECIAILRAAIADILADEATA